MGPYACSQGVPLPGSRINHLAASTVAHDRGGASLTMCMSVPSITARTISPGTGRLRPERPWPGRGFRCGFGLFRLRVKSPGFWVSGRSPFKVLSGFTDVLKGLQAVMAFPGKGAGPGFSLSVLNPMRAVAEGSAD